MFPSNSVFDVIAEAILPPIYRLFQFQNRMNVIRSLKSKRLLLGQRPILIAARNQERIKNSNQAIISAVNATKRTISRSTYIL